MRKVVGEEWKEEMQQCRNEEEWMRKAEERLNEYYKERKIPGNPKNEKKQEERERYEQKETGRKGNARRKKEGKGKGQGRRRDE